MNLREWNREAPLNGMRRPWVARSFHVMLALLLAPGAARAQEPSSAVSGSVAAACGSGSPAPSRSVLAGMVVDSASGAAVPNAHVVGIWWKAGEASATSRVTTADKNGFFAFCDLPGDLKASLTVSAKGARRFVSGLELRAGHVHVERVRLPDRRRHPPGARQLLVRILPLKSTLNVRVG